jgi:hypothetical protein
MQWSERHTVFNLIAYILRGAACLVGGVVALNQPNASETISLLLIALALVLESATKIARLLQLRAFKRRIMRSPELIPLMADSRGALRTTALGSIWWLALWLNVGTFAVGVVLALFVRGGLVYQLLLVGFILGFNALVLMIGRTVSPAGQTIAPRSPNAPIVPLQTWVAISLVGLSQTLADLLTPILPQLILMIGVAQLVLFALRLSAYRAARQAETETSLLP